MKKFALIGKNTRLSPSPYLHQLLFEQHNIDAEYKAIDYPQIGQKEFDFLCNNYNGFNVTMPYKRDIVSFLPKCNLLSVNAVFQKKGYNTDIYGIEAVMDKYYDKSIKKMLILGNGGVADSAVELASNRNIEVDVAVRNINNGLSFTKKHKLESSHIVFQQNVLPIYDVIINCTSVGYNHDEKILCDEIIKKADFVFDCVYNKNPTILCKQAKQNNVKYIDGIPMLVYQADKSQTIWLQRNLSTQETIDIITGKIYEYMQYKK